MSFSDYWGGWACFCISIVMIGVLTAFIGDLASHFGCTIGLKDAITAISFVALGTSVPGKLLQFTTNEPRHVISNNVALCRLGRASAASF